MAISRFIERVQTTANYSLYGYLDILGVFDTARELGYWPCMAFLKTRSHRALSDIFTAIVVLVINSLIACERSASLFDCFPVHDKLHPLIMN